MYVVSRLKEAVLVDSRLKEAVLVDSTSCHEPTNDASYTISMHV